MSCAIHLDSVSKQFPRRRVFPSLKTTVLGMMLGRATHHEAFWALREISLQIGAGTALGIIGPNGSGKTTLLALIARILLPTSGSVQVQGRVGTLLELGAGFHPDLTGRENVFMNAALLGVPQQMVRERFDEIVAFSELGDFIDQPVRTYSAGMEMRLGFAIATHTNPDILLVDELLAVGDEHFQRKCHQYIAEFHRGGGTLLLVSHDLAAVQRVCQEVIWLQNGHLQQQGPPAEVSAAYLAHAGLEGGLAG